MLQRFASTNNARKYMFLKDDCNVQHPVTTGVTHLSAERILCERGHVLLLRGRRSLHNIIESKSMPERTLGPLRLPFSLVVLATKTQPPVFPQAGRYSHPWFCSDLFSSPFQSVLRIKATSDFLFPGHLQPITGSFPSPLDQENLITGSWLLSYLPLPSVHSKVPQSFLSGIESKSCQLGPWGCIVCFGILWKTKL